MVKPKQCVNSQCKNVFYVHHTELHLPLQCLKCSESKEAKTMKFGVYVNGNAWTPALGWRYGIITETVDEKDCDSYFVKEYNYSIADTDEYNDMTEEQKKRVHFSYINGVKQN